MRCCSPSRSPIHVHAHVHVTCINYGDPLLKIDMRSCQPSYCVGLQLDVIQHPLAGLCSAR